MPRGDRTGPAGIGRMSGRGAGFCTGNDVPGYLNPWGTRRAGRYGHRYGRWLLAAGLIPGCVYLVRRMANRRKK